MRPFAQRRRGFTLVELLVVIAIIATLAAILTPAVMIAIDSAKRAAIKLEITKIEQALENYKNQHGDYPPDFADPAVVQRHFRKAFPKMAPDEQAVLAYIIDPDNVTIDRAEALFFALHGYSSDVTHPFTGPGGPLDATTISGTGTVTLAGSTGMTKSLIEFEERNIRWSLSGTSYTSTDGLADDVFPTYVQNGTETPFAYFDARSYVYNDPDDGWKVNSFEDLNNSLAGIAQPYKIDQPNPRPDTTKESSTTWNNLPNGTAPRTLKFANPDKFQIIASGLDGKYSALGVATQPADARVHLSGINYKTEDLDNITNFSNTTSLEGELP